MNATSPEVIAKVLYAKETEKKTYKQISEEYGVSTSTIQRILKDNHSSAIKKNRKYPICPKCGKTIKLMEARYCPYCAEDIEPKNMKIAKELRKLLKVMQYIPQSQREEANSTLLHAINYLENIEVI